MPVKPWKELKICKKYKCRAPQKDYFWDYLELGVGKSEDCLYLNVMAPSWKSDDYVRVDFFTNVCLQ